MTEDLFLAPRILQRNLAHQLLLKVYPWGEHPGRPSGTGLPNAPGESNPGVKASEQ